MVYDELKTAKKAIGAKQAAKAVEKGLAVKVYLASDADQRVISPIAELCQKHHVPVERQATVAELGKSCGIDVGAAAVAVLNN